MFRPPLLEQRACHPLSSRKPAPVHLLGAHEQRDDSFNEDVPPAIASEKSKKIKNFFGPSAVVARCFHTTPVKDGPAPSHPTVPTRPRNPIPVVGLSDKRMSDAIVLWIVPKRAHEGSRDAVLVSSPCPIPDPGSQRGDPRFLPCFCVFPAPLKSRHRSTNRH